MKILKSIVMALAAILLCVNFTSCEKEPILTLSVQQIKAPSLGNSTSVIVNTNNPWTVSGNDWCTVSPSSGEGGEVSVTVTVKENTTYDAKNCTLTFTSAGLTQSISVNQESNYGVVLPKNTYEVSSDAQQISVEVKANIDYDITISADWIKQSGTKALTSKTYIFNVDANSTYDAREGTISVTEKNSGKSEVIKVKQVQKDAIIISSKEYNLSCDAQKIEVKLQTNVDFDIVIPDAAKNWLSHTSTKALVDKTLELDIKANEGYDARACEIILKMKNNMLADTIKIQQAQKDTLFLNVDTVEVKSKGETINCELSSNIEYICEINEDKDWIKQISTKGLNEFKKTFEILGNQAFAPRTGSIIFRNNEKNIADTLFIIQHQVDTVFVDKKDIKATWKGGEYEVTISSNVQYELILPEWITEKGKTASNENELLITTYLFEIAENLYIEKEDNIIFTWNNEGKETETKIYISQECCNSIPNNQIWYTSSDNQVVTPFYANRFGANIVSNDYKYGKGIITFDSDVTLLDSDAFAWCSSLKSITIPNSVTRIGDAVFFGCDSLESITIPNSVTTIGDEVFQGCGSLISITVEEGNAVYDSRDNCNAIIETASNKLIVGCKKTTIPNSVKIIGNSAFYGSSLESIIIPNSITTIGSKAFAQCHSLKNIIMSNNVTVIGFQTFLGCISLKSIRIPNSVTTIGIEAFSQCFSLESIIIPNSVTTIDEVAFYSCRSLKSIIISNSVTKIGDGAFMGCGSLENITIEEGNAVYDSRDNCNAIIETASKELKLGCKNTVIPYGITVIEAYAFLDCSSLTNIIIPSSVTYIGHSAFEGCKSIESITMPNSVTTIGHSAFKSCTSLKNITIPNRVRNIEYYMFWGCTALNSITIPDSVTIIFDYALAKCSNLKKVYCKSLNPPIIKSNSFDGVPQNTTCTLYVPLGSKAKYQTANYWKEFSNIIEEH